MPRPPTAHRNPRQFDLFGETIGQPTLIALPVPRPYSQYGRITYQRVEESFPNAAGGFVDWLIGKSGWTIEEEGVPVPIRPRHIAILFRNFRNFGTDVTRPYVRALEARRIPHVLMGGRSFHDREEVIALRTAIAAIEWPEDELRVFATLRGPFFAFGDEVLLTFRQYVADGSLKFRQFNTLHNIDQSNLDPSSLEVAEALALLRRLHVTRNHRPIAETISALLEAIRAQAGIALWLTGEQALGNCQRMIDMAQQFEQRATSFRSFVEKLEADAERGEVEEAPILEEGTEGVRIMTVHKAKGLEFPVVVLADPTCAAAHAAPSRHVDPERELWLEPLCGSAPIELLEAATEELRRDRAEAIRLAYVAVTRARDLLVVPATGDQPIERWLGVLNPVLFPPGISRRNSSDAPGCPKFGEDSVLDRGPKGQAPREGSVRPGLHVPVSDGPSVVWWDPAVIDLDVDDTTSIRHQRILEAGPSGSGTSDSEKNYVAWKTAREELLRVGSQPSLRIQTVTSLIRDNRSRCKGRETESAAAASFPVEVEIVKRPKLVRPGGRRFGVLVHAVLASIDLEAGTDAIRSIVRINAKIVNATDEEAKAACVVVQTVLKHPILRRAAGSAANGMLRRETQVIHKLADDTIVEGVVDLAFQEEGPGGALWTVVDFKTDREFSLSSERHVEQVRIYAGAIAAATGNKARGVVMVI